MKPKVNNKTNPKKKTATVGVLALAVVALLAGASVSASLEEFAAPVYAEEDPYNGAVDDITADTDWDEIQIEEKKFERGLKNWIHKGMKDRMEDRMEDREEHLQKRITLNSNVLSAIEFCISDNNCTANHDLLNSTALEITDRAMKMQATLDGIDISDLKENKEKDKSNMSLELNEEMCTEKGGSWINVIKSGEDVFYCDFKETLESKSDKKLAIMEAVKTAISFCIDSEGCEADSEELTMIIVHMDKRQSHEKECKDGKRCKLNYDQRKGLIDRIRGILGFDEDEESRQYSSRSSEFRTDIKLEVSTNEECETLGGIWDEEKSMCYKDCNKDDERENLADDETEDEQSERPSEDSDTSNSEDNRER